MSGIKMIDRWEDLLKEELREANSLLDVVRLTDTARVQGVVYRVERRLDTALGLKVAFQRDLLSLNNKNKGSSSEEVRQKQYQERLHDLEQQLLALQINWEMMSGKNTHHDDIGKDHEPVVEDSSTSTTEVDDDSTTCDEEEDPTATALEPMDSSVAVFVPSGWTRKSFANPPTAKELSQYERNIALLQHRPRRALLRRLLRVRATPSEKKNRRPSRKPSSKSN